MINGAVPTLSATTLSLVSLGFVVLPADVYKAEQVEATYWGQPPDNGVLEHRGDHNDYNTCGM